MRPGRTRKRLAALLQANFPEASGGVKLTWSADWLYPAAGFYRTDPSADCCRWEGFARHYREDGTYCTIWSVYSWHTMTELLKFKKLSIDRDGHVSGEKE